MLDFQLYFIWISKNTQKYWNVYNIYLKYNGSQANKQNSMENVQRASWNFHQK